MYHWLPQALPVKCEYWWCQTNANGGQCAAWGAFKKSVWKSIDSLYQDKSTMTENKRVLTKFDVEIMLTGFTLHLWWNSDTKRCRSLIWLSWKFRTQKQLSLFIYWSSANCLPLCRWCLWLCDSVVTALIFILYDRRVGGCAVPSDEVTITPTMSLILLTKPRWWGWYVTYFHSWCGGKIPLSRSSVALQFEKLLTISGDTETNRCTHASSFMKLLSFLLISVITSVMLHLQQYPTYVGRVIHLNATWVVASLQLYRVNETTFCLPVSTSGKVSGKCVFKFPSNNF